MSFAAPWWLAALALVFAVLALHIRRRRTIPVGSVVLWRQLQATSSHSRIIKPPTPSLALLLQLLAVVLVALALAGPRLGAAPAAHRVYVLDGSGSMATDDAGGPRFEAARAELLEDLRRTPPSVDSRVSIILADAEPEIVAARLDEPGALQDAVAALAPSNGTADWAEVATYVAAVGGSGPEPRVTVLTDGADPAAAAVAADAGLRVFGSGATQDVAVTAHVTQVLDDDGEPVPGHWRAEGTLRVSGLTDGEDTPEVPEVQIRFQPEGTDGFLNFGIIRPRRLTDEGTATFVQADIELPGAGILSLSVPADARPNDDAAYFVLGDAPRSAAVLYVGAGNVPLIRALQAVKGVEIYEAPALPEDTAGYDLVIVDDVPITRHPNTSTLWLGAPRAPDAAPPELLADPAPTGWLADHPVADGVDWSSVEPASASAIAHPPGSAVLLEASGHALVVARTIPAGREIVVAFDPASSGWTETAAFPVFIGNVVRWAVPDVGTAAPFPCTVGQVCPLEARFLSGTIAGPDDTETVLAPLDAAFLPDGADIGFRPSAPGVYAVAADGRTIPVAVNPAPAELTAPATGLAVAEPARAQVNLAPWLAGAALLVILAEALLAGLGSDRFLRLRALSRENPLYGRRRAVLALEGVTVLLLIAALAGVPLPFSQAIGNLVVVADPLAPGGEAATDALIANADAAAGDGGARERVGLVDLAAVPTVTSDLGAEVVSPQPSAPGIDAETALRLAAAMIPPGEPGRIVLATDGIETSGNLYDAAPALEARGLPVDVAFAGAMPPGDVWVENLVVPDRVFTGEAFPLEAFFVANRAAPAIVEIMRDGALVSTASLDLLPGRNRLSARMPAAPEGTSLYQVRVAVDGDPVPANDRNGVMVQAAEPPHVAILTPELDAGRQMADALQVQGLVPEVIDAAAGPSGIEEWLEYDAVILMNTPALALTAAQQTELASYVEDHGRGLLILGGANSFGPGGYLETPLERLSPLSSRIRREAPETLLLFVLDRSGSMDQPVGTTTRLAIAKQAIERAVELLDPRAQVSIVVFDYEAQILMPPQPRPTPEELGRYLDNLVPGGGTFIYPGLEAAVQLLEDATATQRHVVVMTDGLSQAAEYDAIVNSITELGATISAIAIGNGADQRVPQMIAELGGGAFYYSADFEALPSILSQEALLLGGAPVEERSTTATWADRDAPFLEGMPATLPTLEGYVLTTAKDGADVHMTITDTEGDEYPLLASWQVGNGRVVAMASEGAGAWAENLMAMAQYPRLWAQSVRWTLADAQGPGFHLAFARHGDDVVATLDALAEDGTPLSGLALTGTIARPADGWQRPAALPFAEVSPGRYVARFTASTPGNYVVKATDGDEGVVSAPFHAGYPARFLFSSAEPQRFSAFAAATGGALVDPTAALSVPSERRWVGVPGFRFFLAAALLTFMLALVIRYAPGLLMRRRRSGAGGRVPAGVPASA